MENSVAERVERREAVAEGFDFVAILFENHPQVFSNQGMIVDHQNLALHQGCPFHGVCANPG